MSGFDPKMLGQLALQYGGTAAGEAVGGPLGAGVGGALGGGAGRALFADDQKHGMAVQPAGGPQAGGPALQILQQLHSQMQQQEQQRQQAIMALLQQYAMPQQQMGMMQGTQMESRR